MSKRVIHPPSIHTFIKRKRATKLHKNPRLKGNMHTLHVDKSCVELCQSILDAKENLGSPSKQKENQEMIFNREERRKSNRQRLRNPWSRRSHSAERKRKIDPRIISSGTTFERPPERRTRKNKSARSEERYRQAAISSIRQPTVTLRETRYKSEQK